MSDAKQYLPEGDDKAPKGGGGSGRYMKFKKGEPPRKFRVLARPVSGMLKWTADKRPVRVTLGGEFPTGVAWEQENRPGKSGDRPAAYFWLAPVWDYGTKQVMVWESTQATIHKALRAYAENEEYGDFTGYDVTVTRDDSADPVTYSVVASPPKPLAAAVAKAWETCQQGGFDLTRLYDGGDPFSGPAVAAVAGGESDDDVPF